MATEPLRDNVSGSYRKPYKAYHDYDFGDVVWVWVAMSLANDFWIEFLNQESWAPPDATGRWSEFGWLQYEIQECMEDLLVFDDYVVREERGLQWLLEHGIAPGQPFQVAIRAPDYQSETSTREYDVSYSGPAVVRAIDYWAPDRVYGAILETAAWYEDHPA